MTPEELDAFMRTQRMCRVASVGADGRPHNSPLWFVWDGSDVWFNSVVRSQRWVNLNRNPNVSVVVDSGNAYGELCGVELIGAVQQVGEVPRTSKPDSVLALPEQLFGEKYSGGPFHPDGRHAWLRLPPKKIVSWDFKKIQR
jgi:Pyridoxamine 5'-phosphate oxidase